ncbi:MAG: alpha/beta fold hydrolase [Gammaproteobacteria bacterium]|nr:alpha/beta fold hydrolase [Gammaproteobacteria bacterium]
MSNKPSFLDRLKKTELSVSMAKKASLAFNKLAPNWTYQKVEDLFLTPTSRKVDKKKLPHRIQSFQLDTNKGLIQGYRVGQGPTVVLVHDWSGGAHQFFPLMRGLSQCGFQAIAFDHFGHGHSEGQHASLLLFTAAVNSILHYVNKKSADGLAAIVGHSMGCIAIANAQPNLIKGIPLFLISPVFNFKKYFIKQVKLQELHPDLSKQYLSKFEKSYLSDLDGMELKLKLCNYASDTIIVHDKEDKESGILDSIKFCSAYPLTKLVVTKGYGHVRIINSETVWQQLKSQLNYEDITSTPFN